MERFGFNSYRTPSGDVVLMRLDTTKQDKQRKLNRSENLRQIPPAGEDFKRLYGRRADAESINRALDDTLGLRRAHPKVQTDKPSTCSGLPSSPTPLLATYMPDAQASRTNE